MAAQAARTDEACFQVPARPAEVDAQRKAGPAMPLDPLIAALSRAAERSAFAAPPGLQPGSPG